MLHKSIVSTFVDHSNPRLTGISYQKHFKDKGPLANADMHVYKWI